MKNRITFLAASLLCLMMISACQKTAVNPSASKLANGAKFLSVAEPDTAITLPQDSIILRGHAENATGPIAGYLWSQISGPNEAHMINESSATAKAKGLISGRYSFQFMVILQSGLAAVDSVVVTVKPSDMQTLTLSPSNNPFETNIGVLGGVDASNHTSIEEPLCAWTIQGVPITVRNLLKFDLSSIPSNATILSADLIMYSDTIPQNGDLVHANFGNDNSVMVQQVAAAWDPATVGWFNQPSGLTANQVLVPNTPQPYLNADINVKDMVSSMVTNNSNYGFKLSLVNEVEYTSRIFCSSYYADASRHPKLIVKYQSR
ncbi:MAG: DNRLRE domain-containing protein [Sphingobacteriales bacterium]